MALGNFFDKVAFGASQILHGFDSSGFTKILSSHVVRIRFYKSTVEKKEAVNIVDLLVRLLSRFYPNLQIECIDDETNRISDKWVQLAKTINPEIETSAGLPSTVNLNIGEGVFDSAVQQLYLGSDRWIAKFSLNENMSCGNSSNPFGAGAAACIGAANLFRFVFKEQLPFTSLDNSITFSTFNHSINEFGEQGPELEQVSLEDTLLVGLGAIGNGTLWALHKVNLKGDLVLIDHEEIEISNLQRYVLATQADIKKQKVLVAKDYMQRKGLKLHAYHNTWEEYLQVRKDWLIRKVMVAVDSAETRIEIQTSLPEKIINSWTQPEQIGISKHYNFPTEACLTCLYFPENPQQSLSQEIAENLNMLPLEKTVIRSYLADKKPVDDTLIDLISTSNNIPRHELSRFKNSLLEVFHSKVVCGGILMKLTGGSNSKQMLHVPSAFESALAGILLAAEMVIDNGKLRDKQQPNVSKINMMRPLTKYTLENVAKHRSGRCICQDVIATSVYNSKWNK